jgi:two-component system repressor protein LuxO
MTAPILLVEDSPSQAAVYRAYLEANGRGIVAMDSGEAALDYLQAHTPSLVLLDLHLGGIQGLDVLAQMRQRGSVVPVIVISDDGSADNVVEAMRLGAVDFLTKPFGGGRLEVTVANAIKRRELDAMVQSYQAQFSRDRFCGFIGGSLVMQSLYRIIESAAPSRATIFITGESGTGKELCAAAIHAQSRRKDGRFVAVNCAALPHDLMESETFGHVKGAFTGAHRQREGAASLADGGTLFLDEIGEMDLDLQSKLLRFVQTGEFQRVGSGETIRVDTRIVCATNRDPLEMVRQGRLREDLYYRLHVVPVHLPPLRDRGADILLVARAFLSRYSGEEGKLFSGFTPEVERMMLHHRWPGNVRELENVVRNIVVLNSGDTVTLPMLPPSLLQPVGDALPFAASLDDRRATGGAQGPLRALPPAPAAALIPPATIVATPVEVVPAVVGALAVADSVSRIRPLWEVERDAIESAIAQSDGNIPRAAAALEISPSTIYRKRQSWTSDACVP